jgi:nicotinate-nucleotide pyrophosphorylase (carboxylating)
LYHQGLNDTIMKYTNLFSASDPFSLPKAFSDFFTEEALTALISVVDLSIIEDGPDFTTNAIFSRTEKLSAQLVAKEKTLVVGLPIAFLALGRCAALEPTCGALANISYVLHASEGDLVEAGTVIAEITGPARLILKAERIILNFITHLSGIANLTRQYVEALKGTGSCVLDTRKTLPGLRYPEKYAVLMGGGLNHRKNLKEMLMLKDNHIDAGGGITQAVSTLRAAYSPCPPIEVECRTLEEVHLALAANVDRIMLDNMDLDMLSQALACIPETTETEVSGGVSLQTIRAIADISPRGPDFISVGRLTHSAPAADFSLRITRNE